MNLLRISNIIKHIIKREKTTEEEIASETCKPPKVKNRKARYDLFLILAIFILVASPIAFRIKAKIDADRRLVNLYLSQRFEDIFGKEITERLLAEYNGMHADIRVRLYSAQDEREADIIIYDESDEARVLKTLADLNIFTEENDETLMSVPLVSFMDVLFYNIDALSAAGFDRPPRTRGEYQTYSRTAADSGLYSDDLLEPEFNRPAVRKLEDFAAGRAAMIVASTRAIPSLRERMGDDKFGITTVPYAADGTVGRYSINISGIYAGINKNSEYKNEAWDFINYLKGHSTEFCEMFKAVPGTVSDVIPGDYVKDDPFYSKAWDIFEYNNTEGLQN